MFEVVINPGELEKEHADLIRKQLLANGFHNDSVSVRSVNDTFGEQEEH